MPERMAGDHSALFSDLVAIMQRLRSASGCPWDREQSHRSLRPCLLEETYEVLDAIDRNDLDALRQELGDVLLQVVFHAQLAAESHQFDIGDVIRTLRDKLVRRHPHVFGESSAETPEEVLHQWDALKRRERGEKADSTGTIEDVPQAMPALCRAAIIYRRAARAGFKGTREATCAMASGALKALLEGKYESGSAEEIVGDLLFAVVELAHAAQVDAEQALRERVNRLIEEVRESARDPDAVPISRKADPG